MQRRGGLVIQQLSQRLGGLRVYRELSRLLQVRLLLFLLPPLPRGLHAAAPHPSYRALVTGQNVGVILLPADVEQLGIAV